MKRRECLKSALTGTAGVFLAPALVPASVLGKEAPSHKIQIGQIGCGRIARVHDLPEVLRHDEARVIAVCDVDRRRLADGKAYVEQAYAAARGREGFVDVATHDHYREMLADPGIDAVVISTPDHWHAQVAMEAAWAGKDIYLQKPLSLTIAEGRALSDAIHRTGRILQVGSQQRSTSPWPQFRRACELVRNGRIGELRGVKIGLPGDPSGPEEPEMPVPPNLDYDQWLGSTPVVYYTEKRVHPQADYSRPGWLRCEQFGAGMITGWGAHHVDTAHWGMDEEYGGPLEVEAQAEFPTSGLWDVHGSFSVRAVYEGGVVMKISGELPNGVRFEGSEGWIFVARSPGGVTSSDPGSGGNTEFLAASDPAILRSEIGPDEVQLYRSEEQHLNWLRCIRTRKPPVSPAEISHRSCSACLVSHTAMKLGRKLRWDPRRERFKDDDEANAMLSRPQRHPYGTTYAREV
ncbi:MAG: Gfo/Idh/MocA family oxidoreductase [Acidobacteria bacterium]|jgi:predicted dehydrogenase|nr:Gfo/Idh/MocA family oxidoreductase [Acidobacteriota bacterium]